MISLQPYVISFRSEVDVGGSLEPGYLERLALDAATVSSIRLLGEYKGSQARECLITLEDWQSLQSSVHADQTGASAANGEPTSV